jgi:hypothetical protein
MGDKLRQGISVLTTFVEGEQPSPAKLNSITAQLRFAAEQLEKAVGDIRGESWPYTSATTTTLSQKWGKGRATGVALAGAPERKLDIVNLARLVGPSSNLNPQMIAGETSVEDNVPVGVHEFSLQYPVSGTVDGTNPAFTDVALTTFVSVISSLANTGEYHVTAEGKVFCVTATVGGVATYTTNPTEWGGGVAYHGATFNVIPDPNQVQAGGAALAFSAPDAAGARTITLPLIQYQQHDINGTFTSLDDEDINYQQQLELPAVLQENFAPGDIIPDGFLFLKNETTGEFYVDAVYSYFGPTAVVIGDIDISEDIANGHSFSIVTVGTDITTSIDDLRTKSRHAHDRRYGEPFAALDGVTGFLTQAGNSGPFVPSEIPGSFAPQYLHRDGYAAGVDANLNDSNVMRGALGLGIPSLSAGSYIAEAGAAGATSASVFWGHPSLGPRIRANNLGVMEIVSQSRGMEITAEEFMRLESNTDGIRLVPAIGHDVHIGQGLFNGGGLEVEGPVSENALVVSDYPGTSIHSVGNLGSRLKATYGHGLATGPHSTGSDLWVQDDATLPGAELYVTGGWVRPVFQLLHYAEANRTFEGFDIDGAGQDTATDVGYWEGSISLPTTFTHEHVLGLLVLLRGPDGNDQWITTGFDPRDDARSRTHSGTGQVHDGEKIYAFIDKDTNDIILRAGAGGATGQNAFNADAGSDGTPATINVDIKVTLLLSITGSNPF